MSIEVSAGPRGYNADHGLVLGSWCPWRSAGAVGLDYVRSSNTSPTQMISPNNSIMVSICMYFAERFRANARANSVGMICGLSECPPVTLKEVS